MNILFEQEELRLLPLEGTFDVEKTAQAIAKIGFSFRDEAKPKWFGVCEDEASRTAIQQERRDHPERGFPRVLVFQVEPEEIVLYQSAGRAFAPYAREFVAWVAANYRCKVSNEMEADLTAELAGAVSEAL